MMPCDGLATPRRGGVRQEQHGMLTSWKPPDVLGAIAIVLTVPACRLSVAALPAMTMSWSLKIVNALEPLVKVLNVVGQPTSMSAAVSVPPLPSTPVNTTKVFAVVPVPGARFTKRTAAWLAASEPEKSLSSRNSVGLVADPVAATVKFPPSVPNELSGGLLKCEEQLRSNRQ